jgi:hypothetical protein
MTASALVNRAKMTVSGTPGTGTITLGSAATGAQSFASAGVANSALVSYIIEDGANWEVGQGTYTTSGTTLSRGAIASSSGGSAISASTNALVSATALAADIVTPATLNALIASYLTGLSTSLPGSSGQLWNNAGVIAIS